MGDVRVFLYPEPLGVFLDSNLPKLAILASGRGSNCRAILNAVRNGRLRARAAAVVSDNPQAPVLTMAKECGIDGIYIDPGRKGARLAREQEAAFVTELQSREVEWVALAGFMRILGEPLLSAFPGKILNIHPSLLPSFPGLDGPGQAWKAGVKVAGCTVHFVDAGIDTGPIIAQQAVPVLPEDTEDSLRSRILEAEHKTYIAALGIVMSGAYAIEDRRVIYQPAQVPAEESQ